MQNKLFILLRLGLELSEPTDADRVAFDGFGQKDWRELIAFAWKHAVGAIAFDGYQKLFDGKHQVIDKPLLLQWFAQTISLEKRNGQQVDILKHFGGRLIGTACDIMLMKGQANALYYPTPLHRSTGDVDIFTFGTYDLCNRKARELGAKVDESWYKHSQIFYNGEMFENHRYIVHTREGKRSKLLNEDMCKLATSQPNKLYKDTGILLPSPEFNAKFLTYHALTHFLSEGLRLKQVVDWVMFVNAEKDNVNWLELYSFCEKFHLRRFLDVMNDIAIHQFGVRIDNKEIVTTSSYTEKVLNSILFDDDFVFGSGEGGWRNRLHLLRNLWNYRWKYHDIYQECILKQLYYYVSGYLLKTENLNK